MTEHGTRRASSAEAVSAETRVAAEGDEPESMARFAERFSKDEALREATRDLGALARLPHAERSELLSDVGFFGPLASDLGALARLPQGELSELLSDVGFFGPMATDLARAAREKS